MAISKRDTVYDQRFLEGLMREKEYRDQKDRENWAKREKEEALQKGIEQGVEKGIKQGLAEGREEGARKNLLQNIKGLLKFGMPEDSIKKALNCTDEQIREAKAIIK